MKLKDKRFTQSKTYEIEWSSPHCKFKRRYNFSITLGAKHHIKQTKKRVSLLLAIVTNSLVCHNITMHKIG